MEELQRLVKAFHSRGIREKVLQKQIQKHTEYMIQLCANSKDGWSTFHCSHSINSDVEVLLWRYRRLLLFLCVCGGSN